MGLPGLTRYKPEADGLRVFGCKADSARTLLVLVHGFRGNGETTWGQTPSLLLSIPQRTFDVAIYQYPSRSFPVGLVGVDGLAEALVQDIKEEAEEHCYSQVGLAGHSMGGLIVSLAAKLLLARTLTGSPNQAATPVLSGLLCVGTPWDGISMAWLASPKHPQLRDLSPRGFEVRGRAREEGFEKAEANGIWARNLVAMRDGVVAPQSVETALRRYWIKTTHTGAVAATSAEDDKFAPFQDWALRASQASLLVYLRELRRRIEGLGIEWVGEKQAGDLYQGRSATEWEASEDDGANRPGRQIGPDSPGARRERDRLSEVVAGLLHSRDERLGLTGEGGAGKTTALIELAREAVVAAIEQPGQSPVPLLVRLRDRDLGESAPRANHVHEALQAMGDAVVSGPQACAWLEESVSNGGRPLLLVLVDGLDEGGGAQIALVEGLRDRLAPGDRMVAAGRPEAVFRSQSFKTYRLDRLTAAQATRVAERQLGGSQAPKFLEWVEGADPSFIANPGQLEMLLRMWHGERGEAKLAPRCIGELYHRALLYMFGRERDPGKRFVRLPQEELEELADGAEGRLPGLAFRQLVFGVRPDLSGLEDGFLQHLQSSGIVEQRAQTLFVQSWHFASLRWQEYFASLELRRLVQSGEAIDMEAVTRPSLLNIWRMAATGDETGRMVAEAAGDISPVLHAVVLAARGDMNAVDVIVALVRSTGASAGRVPSLLRNTPGRTAVIALSAIVADQSTPEEVRLRAASALEGTQDREALGFLAAALKDPNTPDLVRQQAAFALAGTEDSEALRALVAAITDPNTPEGVRIQTAWALAGTQDPEALKALVVVLKDPNTPVGVGFDSTSALRGAQDPETLRALVAVLKDPNAPEEVRQRAAFVLGGTQKTEAVRALIAALKDPNTPERVRASAAGALTGTQDPEALRTLVAALKDSNTPEVRGSAARALAGTLDQEALQVLITALNDPNTPDEVRLQAAYGLGGTQDIEALWALVAAVTDPNTPVGVREEATSALRGIDDPKALWALVAAITAPNTSEEVRRSAAWALVGTQDPEALRDLVAALKDPNTPEKVRQLAALVLWSPQNPEALRALVAALKDPNTPDEVRLQVASTLQSTQDPVALMALVAVLKDPKTSEALRQRAAFTLETAWPHPGVAQALLNEGEAPAEQEVRKVIARRLVADDVPITEWPE